MFKKLMQDRVERQDQAIIDTLIGNNTKIIGEIKSAKDIRIDGELKGNVEIEGRVIIGKKALIKGDIKASKIMIYGKVQGNIKCLELLEIMETGEVRGEVKAKAITIKEGGKFFGISQMIENVEHEVVEEKKNQVSHMTLIEEIPI